MRRLQSGTLVVHIKKARNLVSRDRNGLSDPYAVILVHGKRRFRTAIEYATLNPVWDQFGEYHGEVPAQGLVPWTSCLQPTLPAPA